MKTADNDLVPDDDIQQQTERHIQVKLVLFLGWLKTPAQHVIDEEHSQADRSPVFFDLEQAGCPRQLGVKIKMADVNSVRRINQSAEDVHNRVRPQGHANVEPLKLLPAELAAQELYDDKQIVRHTPDENEGRKQMRQEQRAVEVLQKYLRHKRCSPESNPRTQSFGMTHPCSL
jgi:hypothetical protein